jgi:class 3 adenylate cyclase/pimeloyl-ACP methyl ester carboxylesterase
VPEPRIQYAKTSDGVSIAYTILGSGDETLICAPNIWGDLQMYKSMPVIRAWWDPLAERGRRIFLYDSRNMGASEHRDLDYSDESQQADLEAIVERAGVERFSLYGFLNGCTAAVQYAVARPERVERLVLVDPFARGADYYTAVPQMAMTSRLSAATSEEEEIFFKTVASITVGFRDATLVGQVAEMMRSGASPEETQAFSETSQHRDMTDLLPRLTMPTLVIHMRRLFQAVLPLTQEVARLIPNAEFAEIGDQATEASILSGDMDWSGVDLVDSFLRGEREQVRKPAPELQTPFRTVLFTDLVGHSEMMSRLGDARGREVLRGHERITRQVLEEHGGTEVKVMGDGFMASFVSVTKAVECAIALQRAIAEHNEKAEERLRVRVGLNAGEPIEEEGDLFGATVILASRIAAKAEAGEILVANAIRELCSGKGFVFADRGEFAAKGFEDPVRVYEVRWRGNE